MAKHSKARWPKNNLSCSHEFEDGYSYLQVMISELYSDDLECIKDAEAAGSFLKQWARAAKERLKDPYKVP